MNRSQNFGPRLCKALSSIPVRFIALFMVSVALHLYGNGTVYYFDVNGNTAGFGAPSGTYSINTGTNWSTSNVGTAATATLPCNSQMTFGNSTADFANATFTINLDKPFVGGCGWSGLLINSNSANITMSGTQNDFLSGDQTWTVAGGSTFNEAASWPTGNGGTGLNFNGVNVTLTSSGSGNAIINFNTMIGLNNNSRIITQNGSNLVVNLNISASGTQGTDQQAGYNLTNGTLNFHVNNAFNRMRSTDAAKFTINGGTIDNTSGSTMTLDLYQGTYVISNSFTFTGTNDLNFGTYAVALNATPTITVGKNNLTIGGVVSGGFGLTKAGSGTMTLTGANTYTGTTTISAGMLKVQGVAFSNISRTWSISQGAVLNIDGNTGVALGTTTLNGAGTLRFTGGTFANEAPNTPNGSGRNITMSLSTNSLIDVQSGATMKNGGWQNITWTGNLAALNVDGTFDLWDGNDVYVDALTGSGTVTRGMGGGSALIVGANNGSGTFSGVINSSNNPALTKIGSGTQTLSGASTYTGATTINAGTLNLTGSLASGSAVSVASGATLTGTGNAAGTVTVANNGIVAPGNGGVGTLTTGPLILNSSSVLNFELNAPGTNDKIAVNGNLSLAGNLNVTPLSGFGVGTYTLLTYTGTLTNNGLVLGALPSNYTGSISAASGSVVLTVSFIGSENYSQWSHDTVFTINTTSSGANVSGTVTNFPLLIRLTSSFPFGQALSGGADIRFAKADGTHLPYQIEQWVDNTSASIWVKVDTVYGNNGSQNITMYWGKSGVPSASNGFMVFDTASSFTGVWHLNDISSLSDATYRQNTGANNSTTNAAGIAGNAASFASASSQNITIPTGALSGIGQNVTMSFWTYGGGALPKEAVAFSATDGSSNTCIKASIPNSSSQVVFDFGDNTGYDEIIKGAAAAEYKGQWNHWVFTHNSATMSAYLNGVLWNSGSCFRNIGTPANFKLGSSSAGSNFYDGSIDEFEIAKTERSAAWAKLSYETQKLSSSVPCIGTVPSITQPAASVSINEGSVASFTVAPSSGINFQWQRSNDNGGTWANVSTGSGGTSATYTLTTAYTDSNANFRCLVTSCGTVTSNTSVLKVCKATAITTQPSIPTAIVGSTAGFTVAATGSGLTYQWQSDSSGAWAAIPGATSTTCNVTTYAPDTLVHYRCVVTGACGSIATSNSVGIRLCFVPTVSTPANQSILKDSLVTFSVTASGRGTLGYQWYKSIDNGSTFSPISSATSSSYSHNAPLTDNGTQFRCVVSSSPCTTSTSGAAVLTVCSLPVITGNPLPQTVMVGNRASFTVTATGGTGFQWQRKVGAGAWGNVTDSTLYTYNPVIQASDTNIQVRCIVYGGCSGQVVSNAAALTICYGVSITTQPSSRTITAGLQDSFVIVAGGTGLSYQWQKMAFGAGSFTDIAGANSSHYVLTTVVPDTGSRAPDSGAQYRCVVTGTCNGSLTSSAATANVNTTPIISRNPSDTNVTVGSTAVFSVQARGTITSYQWQKTVNGGTNWNNVTVGNGGTTAVYSFTTTISDTVTGVQFRCIVTGPSGSVTSGISRIGLCFPAVIQTSPQSNTVTSGNAAAFTVIATGTALSYQWDSSKTNGSTWFAITGATSATYSKTVASADSGLQYRCRVVASCGASATSGVAILSVCTPVAISAQPAPVSVAGGANATFSVTATGTAPTYQWQRSRNNGTSWSNVAGASATTASLSIPADTVDTNALFRCVVTGNCGTVTSNSARLTICYPILVTQQPSDAINVLANSSQTFRVRATGVAMTYQWEKSVNHGVSWNTISGQTLPDYGIIVTAVDDSAMFHCKISTLCATTTSNAATLVLCYPPTISVQPANTTVNVSDTASFSITAAGTGTLAYQWQRKENGGATWTNVGTSSASYKFAVAQTDSNARFRCIVSNCSNITSSEAVLTTSCVSTVVTVNPAPVQINVRDSAVFTVTATGKMLTYQWQHRYGTGVWSNSTGAVAARYAFKSDTIDTNSSLRCVVGGSCNSSVTSAAAAVTLCFPVAITTQPLDQSIVLNQTVSFLVAGSGRNVSYQWQRSENGSTVWANVGTNSPSYAFNCVASDSGAKFRCTLTSNPCGSATSTVATLTVCVPPVVYTHPQSTTVIVGDTAKFTVAASGNNIGYQWQLSTNGGVNWTSVGGATTASYNFKTDSTQTNVQVRCIASGVCNGFDTSHAAVLTLCYPVTIVTQPANQGITAGQSVTFTITAKGSNLTYQWQRNGVNALGENGTSYTFATRGPDTGNVSPDNGAQIRCIVSSNCGGTATSTAVTLTVCTPPSITTDPHDAGGVKVGDAATFTVGARGTGLAYQWQRSDDSGTTWKNGTGDTMPVYSFITQAQDTGARVQFRCIVTGSCGSVTSTIARVGLCFPVSIIEHPRDTEVTNGLQATFRVRAIGTGLRYQWQDSGSASWTAIAGANSSAYAFAVAASNQGHRYRCVVNDSCGTSTTSNSAGLTVCVPVAVTVDPRDTMVVVANGDTAVFSVTAGGTQPAYQWQKSLDNGSSWTPVASATASVCRVKVDTADTGALFRCIVAGRCGTVTSATARLRVCYPVVITQQPGDAINIPPDGQAAFHVRANGFDLLYQWERSVNGGTIWDTLPQHGNDYSLTVKDIDQGSKYRCRVSTICGSVASNPATLTVCAVPAVTVQPTNQGVIEGHSASFAITATGSNRSYQWIRKSRGAATAWDTIGNAIDTFYTFAAAKLPDDSTCLRCIVKGSCGTDTSKVAVLTVYKKAKAWFTMSDTIGPAPFEVRLTDSSSGSISQWAWSFGDSTGAPGMAGGIQVKKYDSVGVYSISLAVQGPGGTDTISRKLTVYSKTGNPVLMTGAYRSPDSVALVLWNYGILRSTIPPPFVSTIRLWYQNGAMPADSTTAKILKTYDLKALQTRGALFNDTVAVPRLKVPDTTYGFMTQIVWNDGRVTPFSPVNGTSVIMRDTVHPSNGTVLSGKYTERDTVTFYVDNVQKINLAGADSIGLWYGLGTDTVPYFTGVSVTWWNAANFVAGAVGGRVTYVVQNAAFNTDRKLINVALVVLGKNKLQSPVVRGSFMIGRIRPQNPLILHATALTPGSILVTWKRLLATDSVERVRIYYRSGTPLPIDQYDYSSQMPLDSIVLTTGLTTDTSYYLANRTPKTMYYFVAHTYRNGMWSRVTAASSANDSTPESGPPTIINTISGVTAKFDTATNNVRIYWQVDTAVGSGLEIGYTYAAAGPGGPRDTIVKFVKAVTGTSDSALVGLGGSLLFDTDYHIYLTLRKGVENWTGATAASTVTVHTPPFIWQAVSYRFTLNGDTAYAVNGTIRFVTGPVTQAQVITGTIVAFNDSLKLSGFLKVGPSIQFTERQQSDPFDIAIKCVVPTGYGLKKDVRIYRYDGTSWLVERGTLYDTVNSFAYLHTNDLALSFAAMIDTQPPSVKVLSDTGSAVPNNISVIDTIAIADNVGNLQWRYRCTQGGDLYATGDTTQDSTLKKGIDTAKVYMQSSLVSSDNGVRAIIIADDGHFIDTVNLSRNVVRDSSDAVETAETKWTPLRVTAVLDSPQAGRLFRYVDTASAAPKYDDRFMRLFRWYPDASNVADKEKWVEYNAGRESLFRFIGGRLFWIKTRKPVPLDFGRAVTTSQRDTLAIRLNAKAWTDFALPYRYNMKVGDLIAASHGRSGGKTDSLQMYHWIRDTTGTYRCQPFYIANLSSSGYDDPLRVMSCKDELSGFTVYNPNADTVQLRIPPVSETMSRVVALHKKTSTISWAIRVAARTGDGTELTPVYCGYTAEKPAGNSYYPSAPSFGNVTVGVYEQQSGGMYGHKVVRGMNNNGCAYLLMFGNSAKSTQTVSFTLERLGAFSPQMSTAVYNALTGETVPVTTGELAVKVDGESTEYRWLFVGDANYIASAARQWAGLKLALTNVYPNPVRRFVHLQYTLPFARVARVEFTVLDIMGRQVWKKSIKEESVLGGRRDYVWYGAAANGRRVAAGVYVLKMAAFDSKNKALGVFDRRLTVMP